ncbi:hypothetical protein Misp01_26100 [Microtetraspora sp. NBRC 13810]|nr:hypothetical protein Misp01_26100 [Microtetraspora sp. NBRC 13810]
MAQSLGRPMTVSVPSFLAASTRRSIEEKPSRKEAACGFTGGSFLGSVAGAPQPASALARITVAAARVLSVTR